jgi:sugar phosphate isomerase/epimerase
VRAAGGHDTCLFGEGVVPIEECVRTLQRRGYRGGYGVEHEPDHYDPTAECTTMLTMLRGWLDH